MKAYPVRVKYRPVGSSAWLFAEWDQIAPDLAVARRVVFALLAANRCEWASLTIDY